MPEIKKLKKSQVEITGSIASEKFATFRARALQNINEEVNIDGFRKGKVPESVLVAKVGEMNILEEMAELCLSEEYPKIVMDEKLEVIGRPEVHITKIASGNPLEFKIITAVVPEFSLPDYKKIAEAVSSKTHIVELVSEDELFEAVLNIRRSRVDHSKHNHEKMSAEDHQKSIDANLPELTDEFVRTLGDFKTVDDFVYRVKTMIQEDKKNKAQEKKRITVSDKLIEASNIELPDILINGEIQRIERQFEEDVTKMGAKIEDYLKHAKKTIDGLRKEWSPHAEKKAKLQLILNKIAEAEKISVSAEEIESEVSHILDHYKDADRERAAVYAETVLVNEKIYKFLGV